MRLYEGRSTMVDMLPTNRQKIIRKILGTLLILIGIAVILIIVFKKKVGSVDVPPKENEEIPVGEPVSFLKVPEGFQITTYAKNIPGARVIEFAPDGGLIVSQTKEGKISLVKDENYNGIQVLTLAEGLKDPHGIAFHCPQDARNLPCYLYVAQHDQLGRYIYDKEVKKLSEYKKLIDLPASSGDRHTTRTLLFLGSPYEDTLLISIGSSCNVCHEEGGQRGKIIAYDTKTGNVSDYALGLRNTVFMTLNPLNGFVFMTEMGRDGLGDDIPPDEINFFDPKVPILRDPPLNFGWPVCYGKNIHDTEFDKNTYIRNPCMAPMEVPSWVDLQAHSAPLGLAFIPEEDWPESMWFDLLVAYHGSWNRSVPTGYKIVRIVTNEKGEPTGVEDFVTGWLTADGKKLGRPADIKVLSGGTAYISDDMNGVLYRLVRTTE